MWLRRCVPVVMFAMVLTAAARDGRADTKTGVPFLDELGQREQGQLEVLQNRKYNLLNEFILKVGGLPADPYNKGLTGTAGYAIHFSQFVAWEIGNFTYSYNINSGLKDKLERVVALYGLGRPELPEINWFVTSNLVLKPVYGKQAIFNRKVIHVEAYLFGGPAIVNRSTPTVEFSIGGNAGAGLRFWLSQHTSLRVDIQELLFYGTNTRSIASALHVAAGFGFAFGGDE